jgi:lipopolysaccharide transport system ATP-binding protein
MSRVVIHTEGLGKEYRRGMQATSGLLRDNIARALSSPSFLFRRKSTEKFWVLRNIGLEIKEGEVLGLIGRNGSGKTTLLKILSRITRPTEGWAEIRGRVGSLLEVGTGFHPELTGRENAYLSGAILGMGKREITRKFDEIISFAELDDFVDTAVKHYSTGMYVRLAFAVAAHLEPEILMVDEVLAVGDLKFQRKCLGKMGEVASTGRTVILVSHQLSQIRRLCQRVVWLDTGQLRKVGPSAEVVSAYEADMISSVRDGTRPVEGRAQFLRWKLGGTNVSSDHLLHTDGKITVSFFLRVNEPLQGVHLGLTLYGQSGLPLWSRTMEGLNLKPGLHEIRYTLASLPLRPGAYTWRVGVYDSGVRVDDWDGLPQMQVVTIPFAQTRDDIAGFLNVPSELEILPSDQSS